ncbi:LysM peptidoglycan-binding domain-containing protein [Pseudophaeobacter arcticus]|jgi:nucleoid-associated protein YgaU|uniref:LysM peptidoglycan-binding domain-containing protein n=1 Tax=Pseudophaeobacter arcticus TaxID=385492 RepID=UPI0039E48EA3
MAGTGVTGGLSSMALGGAVATVVVVGGATMVWLGVFDSSDGMRSTRDEASNPVVISPSATPPVVIEGVSQQPEPVVSETATAAQQAATQQAEQQDSGQAEQQLASPQEMAAVDTTSQASTGSVSDAPAVETSADGGEAVTETENLAEDTSAAESSDVARVAALALPEGNTAETPLFEAPLLDLVRVGPNGETVIAGRAPAGVRVEVLLDGEVVEQVESEAGGDFVAFADLPPSTQARVISLRASAQGQERLSDSSFIVAPAHPVPAGPAPTSTAEAAPVSEQVATETGDAPSDEAAQRAEASQVTENQVTETVATETLATETLAEATKTPEDTVVSKVPQGLDTGTPNAPKATELAADVASPEAKQMADATTAGAQPDATSPGRGEEAVVAETDPAPQPEATQVAVLRANAEGVTLVQPIAQKPQGKVVLDTISYSDNGEVQLAGRAGAASNVLVYLDNTPAGQFSAAENGSWGGGLEAVDPGVYILRLDEVNDAGKVLSRLETPFKREAPEVLQPPVAEGATGDTAPLVRAVTVQEGDTLWAISQQRYGSGFLYVRVFEANNTAIRDPDLIYPGQVFTLPE